MTAELKSKYDVLEETAKKINAIDNPVKLKIIALLINEGTKSISDVSRMLKLSFSTTYKYLEQLENAGLIHSRSVSENRMKRLFYVQDFNIDLSPKGISNLISGSEQKIKKTFPMLNEYGEQVYFDEKLFSKKYIDAGLPRSVVMVVLSNILENAYDGISLLELRYMFKKELMDKMAMVEKTISTLDEQEATRNSYAHLLKQKCPEAIQMHLNGDIFIKNLSEPKLLNFVHDLRGLFLHGANGKTARNIGDFLKQILEMANLVSGFSWQHQAFDSFNYIIAPLTKNIPDAELSRILRDFLISLEASGTKFYINIDVGVSRFARKIGPVYVFGDRGIKYEEFEKEGDRINNIIAKIIKDKNFKNIFIVYRIWNKNSKIHELNNSLKFNMLDTKIEHTTYIDSSTYFDTSWKKWSGFNRIGELQEIAINLPRLAIKSKTKSEFFDELKKITITCNKLSFITREIILTNFFMNYNTTMKSSVRGKWSYLNLDECPFSIAYTGLKEAMALLRISENKAKFIEDISKIMKNLNENYGALRIFVKMSIDNDIAEHFRKADERAYNIKYKKYSA